VVKLRFTSLFSILLIFSCCNIKQDNPKSIFKEPITDLEFVLIPKGNFLMGSHENLDNDSISRPLHKVTLSKDFWMSRTEVTQRQWHTIMGDEELHPEKPSPFRNVNPDYPIVSISFNDIQNFLKKLNQLSDKYRFRLPTEAEWEYACRAGTSTPFSYGTVLTDSMANYNAAIQSSYSDKSRYFGRPQPVGSYLPNQWGLCDMHGNVWEWVSDWYSKYPKDEVTDPQGAKTGVQKIIRGGSWYFGAENAKSSKRRTHEPDLWGFSIGFRLVCERRN